MAQQAVGDPYAEAIVDLAKMLQIHQQQAGLAGAQMTAGLEEVGELEQTGQAVVVLLLLQLGLGGAQSGDVAAQGENAEGVALVVRHFDPGDLQMASLALGVHHAVLPLSQGLLDRQPGRHAPPEGLAGHEPHEVEEGLIAVDEYALVILEANQIRDGIQQAALQQLLLAVGLLQLLALIDGADHGEEGDGVAVLVIERDLVDLHPVGAGAVVAMELLIQQGPAFGKQAVIFLAEHIPPGHLGIALADDVVRVLQTGFPGECHVGKQVASAGIPAEDSHG